jgi:hypothetical protein
MNQQIQQIPNMIAQALQSVLAGQSPATAGPVGKVVAQDIPMFEVHKTAESDPVIAALLDETNRSDALTKAISAAGGNYTDMLKKQEELGSEILREDMGKYGGFAGIHNIHVA